MSDKKLSEMPLVEIRESTYKLDDMLRQVSAINSQHTTIGNDFTEAILCLGNEINKIKEQLNNK